MPEIKNVLICGTGAFAARIAFDLAATASAPINVTIAGRNAQALNWLRTAANARAAIFGGKARFVEMTADLARDGEAERLVAAVKPGVVVQAASLQTSSVIANQGNAWGRLIAEGGLSVTAATQAFLTLRVARALAPDTVFVNCCLPDVVNGFLPPLGLSVACGTGNVSILSCAFAASLGKTDAGPVKVLSHYQNLATWRQPAEKRQGKSPRVWIDGEEVSDVFARFANVQLTPEPAIEISGGAGVPLIEAMATGSEWRGHAPGPLGLPGGYPVRWTGQAIELDLPDGLSRQEAIAWNAAYEEAKGLVVEADGKVRFTGLLHERLAAASPELANGYDVADVEDAHRAFTALRARLEQVA